MINMIRVVCCWLINRYGHCGDQSHGRSLHMCIELVCLLEPIVLDVMLVESYTNSIMYSVTLFEYHNSETLIPNPNMARLLSWSTEVSNNGKASCTTMIHVLIGIRNDISIASRPLTG